MLKVTSINNVQYTLNKPLSFTSGVQTNYGIKVPAPENNMVEGGLFTGFVGTIAPFFAQISSRAKSIEKGIEKTKLDLTA